ncbi:hypothetical protein PG993_002500 [Apiospora rasikravindrae]|uniref:Uncharacterized protein n=1 Tax=Apiospora rasikravindrae TaxID=990691 RepID=A0ABR1TWU0_9PEZI
MPSATCPGQQDADPFQELHGVLGSMGCNRERFRAAHRFGNIHPHLQNIQLGTRPSNSDEHGESSDGSAVGPNLDYISYMDWGSPSRPTDPTLHARPVQKPITVYVEGNLSWPQIPRTVPELKKPGRPPSRAEGQLQSLNGRHDWKRILGYWPLFMTQREVKLELAEKRLAARFNPYSELCQGVTITPVERAPSPPPTFSIYPRNRKALLADTTTEPVLPLSLIPTERIWRNGGRLEAGHNTAGSDAPLSGSCAAATSAIHNNSVDGRSTTITTTTEICGRPCQAEDDPSHGGICESTEHHPDARVWVCDDHDKLGRHEAARDLRHLATSLRHYACADCCWKIENDHAGQFLDGMGWHVFEVPSLIPSSSNNSRNPNRRHLARAITRCACASKVADRRLCAPHRLEAIMQLHRWHPTAYDHETASPASLHARKNLATAWAAMDGTAGTPVSLLAGPNCPLCSRGMPVDYFGFRGPHGREGRTVAWVCRACLGVVTGVWAGPAWVAGAGGGGALGPKYFGFLLSPDPAEEAFGFS